MKIETVVENKDVFLDTAYVFRYEKGTLGNGSTITSFSFVSDEPEEERPVTFITNGGPGSACAWQLLGFFGPYRIHLGDEAAPQCTPPFMLEDNPYCPLTDSDLVLIDPPGTGWSDLAEDHKDLCSVDGDAAAVAEFIESWLTAHHCFNHPVCLCGESYGTIRMPAVLDALYGGPFADNQRLLALNPSGIILIGSAMDQHQRMSLNPVYPACVTGLPSCASTYAYHHGQDSLEAYEEAMETAPEYLRALFMGERLPRIEQEMMAEKLEKLIGIDEDVLLSHHLQYSMKEFTGSVLPGKEAGIYDGRYLMDGNAANGTFPFPGNADPVADDPAMGRYSTAFVCGMQLFAEKEGIHETNPYRMIDFAVNGQWNYDSHHAPMESLENGMRRNPDLRVLFASGLYDLCTPAGVTQSAIDASDLDRARVKLSLFPSGHMIYVGDESAQLFRKELHAFFREGME